MERRKFVVSAWEQSYKEDILPLRLYLDGVGGESGYQAKTKMYSEILSKTRFSSISPIDLSRGTVEGDLLYTQLGVLSVTLN